jgi:hypothetical protein
MIAQSEAYSCIVGRPGIVHNCLKCFRSHN